MVLMRFVEFLIWVGLVSLAAAFIISFIAVAALLVGFVWHLLF